MTIFPQMTKRARLDDDGRRVRQLELELELARLRRDDEDASREETAAGGDGVEPVVDSEPAPPPAPQTGPSSAPAATPSTAPTATAARTTTQGHGRGRGAPRGGRFASLDNRGLQTVFVCVACDKIYCQACNENKKSLDYWNCQ